MSARQDFIAPCEAYLRGKDITLSDVCRIAFDNTADVVTWDGVFIRDTLDRILERHGIGWSETVDEDLNLFYDGREIAGIVFPRSYSGAAGNYWNEGEWYSFCEPSRCPEFGAIPDIKLNIQDENLPEVNLFNEDLIDENLFSDLEGPINLEEEDE